MFSSSRHHCPGQAEGQSDETETVGQRRNEIWVKEYLGFPSRGGHLNELSESSFVLTFTRGDAGAPKTASLKVQGLAPDLFFCLGTPLSSESLTTDV